MGSEDAATGNISNSFQKFCYKSSKEMGLQLEENVGSRERFILVEGKSCDSLLACRRKVIKFLEATWEEREINNFF